LRLEKTERKERSFPLVPSREELLRRQTALASIGKQIHASRFPHRKDGRIREATSEKSGKKGRSAEMHRTEEKIFTIAGHMEVGPERRGSRGEEETPKNKCLLKERNSQPLPPATLRRKQSGRKVVQGGQREAAGVNRMPEASP